MLSDSGRPITDHCEAGIQAQLSGTKAWAKPLYIILLPQSQRWEKNKANIKQNFNVFSKPQEHCCFLVRKKKLTIYGVSLSLSYNSNELRLKFLSGLNYLTWSYM